MAGRDRYELQIARLDDRALQHDPGPIVEFFDLDDDDDFERVCGQHFVPLACAAERSKVFDQLRQMPFLADYVLQVRHKNRTHPVAQSRSTVGWESGGSRFS
jgi:hypothetical protein